MHKICFTIRFISCLYMFRAHVLIIRRSKLHYTASGIITPIGGRLVHRLRENCSPLSTYRCDDTRGCVMQFWPPDDEHMCSKHVEAWNKTYCKTKSLCIKLVNYWDKKLYMFRTVPLSIIRSFSLYTQQWYMSNRFADSLLAGSGRNVLK